jgi:hypothetical protein
MKEARAAATLPTCQIGYILLRGAALRESSACNGRPRKVFGCISTLRCRNDAPEARRTQECRVAQEIKDDGEKSSMQPRTRLFSAFTLTVAMAFGAAALAADLPKEGTFSGT